MNAVVYLLQVSACMGIFYLFYYALLSRLTFFTVNRWYLLTTLAISFIIPLLTITVPHQETLPQVVQQVVYINKMQVQQEVVMITDDSPTPTVFDWMVVLKLVYAASVAALLIRLVLISAKFFTRIRSKKRIKIGSVNIVRGDKNLNNGSFFNFIFLNGDELSSDELQQIIAHEMLHVKLYHSVDRMLAKVAQIFLWFNPFVYLYARAIEQNHEFEVDKEVGNATDKNKYAELLLHLSIAAGGTLYHNFSMIPLKKRITMLFTKPTRKIKRLIYLLVAPLVLISCLAFAKLKSENPLTGITKSKLPVSDSATLKYRQKSKLSVAQRKAQDDNFGKLQAYFESGEGLEKRQSAEAVKADTGRLSMIDGINNLGAKPLVLINGKEYDKEILYKISNRGMGAWTFYPPNNGNTKYGEKAKDGAVIIDYRNGDITYMSDTDIANLKKRQAAKGKFFSRIRLTKEDGSKYDMAILNRASGSSAAADLDVDGKIAFIVNNKVYNEADFKRLFPADKASYGPSIGVGGVTKEMKERGLKLEGYSLVFEFDPQNLMSPLNAPVKTATIVPLQKINSQPATKFLDLNYRFTSDDKTEKPGAINNSTEPVGQPSRWRYNIKPIAPEGKDTIGRTIKTADKLIAKIPGMEVRADGSVWINNMPVSKARINGVDYDAELIGNAVKTLPPELIEKFTKSPSHALDEPSGFNSVTDIDTKK